MNFIDKIKKTKIYFIIGLIIVIIISMITISTAKNNLKIMIDSLKYSQIIYSRKGEILRVYLNEDEQYIFPIEKQINIPKKLEISVIAFEDRNFYNHHGVNFKSILRAIVSNVKNKKIVSGASTITMQTIKTLRGGERTYLNKTIEIFYAIVLEKMYSKDEILKLYLSNTPYGGNIRGYRSAIFKYFKVDENRLTWAEAATLAVLPNSPSSILKDRKSFIEKRDRLLTELYNQNFISKEDYKLSLAEIPPLKLKDQNNNNIFFCDNVRKQNNKNIVITTLDTKVQKNIDRIVEKNKPFLKKNNIYNTGILVVDTKSREVLGYYGGDNSNFNGGKIDALQRKRNTGSTLKPFLYGLSMDKGLLTPKTMLIDIPSYFGSFAPVNSDNNYRYLVRADKVLQLSLNIPMVRLLNEYNPVYFQDFFQKTNLVKENKKSNYGLSMILGTYEMTPIELASLYTSLGNLGNFKPLKIFFDDKNKKLPDNQLISKGASYLTLDIMSNLVRPNINWNFYDNKNTFYWKTGTSYGERDGWAVGTNKNYTILVWNGNLNNRPGTHLSGLNISAPMMFDILNIISKDSGKISLPKDQLKNISTTKNGFMSFYDNTELTVEVPKNSILKRDPYERKIFIDSDTGTQVNSNTWKGKNIQTKIIYDYGKDVNYYLNKNKIKLTNNLISEKNSLSFIYPKNGMKIQPIKDNNSTIKKVKVTINKNNNNLTYDWYVNKKFIKRGNSTEEFLELPQGENTILVTTNNNGSANIKILVK